MCIYRLIKLNEFNTLEEMINSTAGNLIGEGELVETEVEFEVNGLKGFYLTHLRKGNVNMIESSKQSDIGEWYFRKYILHDGTRQYYIASTWTADSDEQRAICEAVVSKLTTA